MKMYLDDGSENKKEIGVKGRKRHIFLLVPDLKRSTSVLTIKCSILILKQRVNNYKDKNSSDIMFTQQRNFISIAFTNFSSSYFFCLFVCFILIRTVTQNLFVRSSLSHLVLIVLGNSWTFAAEVDLNLLFFCQVMSENSF